MKGLGWDEENWEAREDFHKEIIFISQYLGVHKSKIELDVCHPVGDIVIFVGGKYAGYLDTSFYDFMETGIMTFEDQPWTGYWSYEK